MKSKRLLGHILLFAGYFILYTVNDIEIFSIEFLLTLVSVTMIALGATFRY